MHGQRIHTAALPEQRPELSFAASVLSFQLSAYFGYRTRAAYCRYRDTLKENDHTV